MTDLPAGVLVRALVASRAVRLLLVEARGPAEHTRRIHGLGHDAARIAAEMVVAAALSSAHIKGEEQLTLQIQGSEPRCSVYADVKSNGDLRVRVTPADLRLGTHGTFTGVLMAIKHAGAGEMYRGATGIDGTTLEHGIAAHFGNSTQVDAILRVGCTQAEDGTILSAGGLLMERLPEESDLPSISAEAFTERFGWMRSADLPQLLTQLAFGSFGEERIEVLDRSVVSWTCRCNTTKIEDTLESLGPTEVEAMIREDHGAEVTCHFCGTVYTVTEQRLVEILARFA